MAKKRSKGGSSWKVAYADFVTAMMAFFLLMWILNMVPQEQRKALAGLFEQDWIDEARPTMTPAPGAGGKDSAQMARSLSAEQAAQFAIVRKLRQVMSDNPALSSASGISSDDVGVLLRVNNNLMFRPGSPELGPQARAALEGVLDVLLDYNVFLVIRGHADTSEGELKGPRSLWELSGARAAGVAQYLLSRNPHIAPARLRAVAYGDTRPLVPSDFPDAATSNNRVEFYFHRPEVMSFKVIY